MIFSSPTWGMKSDDDSRRYYCIENYFLGTEAGWSISSYLSSPTVAGLNIPAHNIQSIQSNRIFLNLKFWTQLYCSKFNISPLYLLVR